VHGGQEILMLDLDKTLEPMKEDLDSVKEWTDKIYNKYFSDYFTSVRDMYNKLQSKVVAISNEDLEWILTSLPLELFSASEKLSDLKTEQEVIKMKTKEYKRDIIKNSSASTDAKKKAEAEELMLENDLLITVYSTVISRVESEIAFSKELIMSSKKIWSSRELEKQANPVSSSTVQLPEYNTYYAGKTYIK
jgi:hypothetical protein